MDSPTTPDVRSIVTRRAVLAGAGASAAAGGIGLIAFSSQPARAAVTMGELTLSGDDATVDNPPSRIDVSVSGEYEIISQSVPDKVDIILQCHVDGNVDDIAMDVQFDSASGTYSITEDIFAHRDISQGYFTPSEAGTEKTTEILVRVVVRGVIDGEIKAESYIENTATLTIGLAGMEVTVGGEGSLTVVE